MESIKKSFLIRFTLASILLASLKISTVAQSPFSPEPSGDTWGEKKDKLKKSYQHWVKLKEQCLGNYSYLVKWSSWTGSASTTKITVRDNQVVERKFESLGAPHPDGRPIDKNRWTERIGFIGSNTKGFPPRTLDELYKDAKSLTEKPIPPLHRAVIRMNREGLLLSCYIQDTRIADDAPIKGVNITSISLGGEKSLNQQEAAPSFEKWLANGKKLPKGMMFIGGSPWFDETTGTQRSEREVYEMIFNKWKKTPTPKPKRSTLNPLKRKPFPKHWGDPPKRQTRDLRPLPDGYGMGSGTLFRWIQENLDRDKKRKSQK